MNIPRLSVALLAGVLAGCGSSNDDALSGNAVTPSNAVTTAAPAQTLAITSTQDFASGAAFGPAGAYEQVTGTIKGEVDPKDPKNAIIQDLALAPVNAKGMVEYSADFVMLKPKDMSKANGVLRYDAPNRGNILPMINPTASPGDAVYLERGYVLLYSAWQGDVPKSNPNRLTVTVPVATNPDGSSITGPYVAELVANTPSPVIALPSGIFNGSMTPYAPVTLDNTASSNPIASKRKGEHVPVNAHLPERHFQPAMV